MRTIEIALIILYVVAVTSGCTPYRSETGSATRPPNIILIFADDLGYGDLSSYGHPTIRTPHLDRMASEGIRLTSFETAASVCSPSRAALLTGRYPKRIGLPEGVFGPSSRKGLPPSEITIATALKQQGYRTAMVGKWHLGHNSEEFLPTSHGFDQYFGLPYSNDMIRPWVETDEPLELYRDNRPVEHPVDQRTLTTRYTQEALQFIRQAAGSPFFLYLAHSMPHAPIYVSEERSGKSLAGLYGDVIEEIDWSTGEILKLLAELGLENNTLVIFTSDNGPWASMPSRMFQRDVMPLHVPIEPWHAGSQGLLRGSKASTYEGGFRVPCIIRWPARIQTGQVSADLATTMDLFATLVKVGGGILPADRVIDGNDLTHFLEGLAPSPTETLYYYDTRLNLVGVRQGPWKLRLPVKGQPELYELSTDPAERFNRASLHPDLVEQLTSMMEKFDREVVMDSQKAH